MGGKSQSILVKYFKFSKSPFLACKLKTYSRSCCEKHVTGYACQEPHSERAHAKYGTRGTHRLRARTWTCARKETPRRRTAEEPQMKHNEV